MGKYLPHRLLGLRAPQLDAKLSGLLVLEIFQNKAIVAALSLEWFAREERLLDVWQHLRQSLLLQVPSDIEEKIGAFFLDFLLAHLLAIHVIVLIPLLVERVASEAHVVAESECTVVVHDSVQIVLGLHLELLRHEIEVSDECAHIQVTNREIN